MSDGGSTGEPTLRECLVVPEVAEEFPELRLVSVDVEVMLGSSPREVRKQLAMLSDRFRGSTAIAMRRTAVPWAYRVFYRHVGIDPDAERTPIEAVALERLMQGAFKSENLLDDALTIALVETGVPIWALDGDKLDGPLELRTAAPDERLGRADDAPPLPTGRLVVCDPSGPVAVLFGALARGHGAGRATRRLKLFSVGVAGVPAIHVEEAMWSCLTTLGVL